MDPLSRATLFASAAATTIVVVRTVANLVVRVLERRRHEPTVDQLQLRERLERIELAVDTIAIEVERLGEHHRFNAQLALNKPPALPPKSITPH